MKKLLLNFVIVNLLVITSVLHAYAMPPVLYFSDLVSGPKTGLGDGKGSGAIVTIWGTNLGTSQGTSTVQVGNVPASYVYYWGNADGSKAAGPAQLFTYQKIQTVSFSVPATALDGTNTISVTVGGVTSNTLPFTIRAGNIYFVSTTGSDSNNGSWSSPFKTISYAANRGGSWMPPGSTVYVMDGVTQTPLYIGGSCSTYNNGLDATQLNSVIAYPGALVNITGSTNVAIGNYCGQAQTDSGNNHFWLFSKLQANCSTDVCINAFPDSRIIGLEIRPTSGACPNGLSGISGGSGYAMQGLKFYGNYEHDFGCSNATSQWHDTYFTDYCSVSGCGAVIRPYEMAYNYFSNNKAYGGLWQYDEGYCGGFSSTLKIHHNVVVGQNGVGAGMVTGTCASGYIVTNDVWIWNNLFINVGQENTGDSGHATGISFTEKYYNGTIYFWNNTLYGYGTPGDPTNHLWEEINYGPCASYCSPSNNPKFNFRNNIFVDTNNAPFDNAGNTVPNFATNELYYSAAGQVPPTWETSPIIKNPQFNNPVGNDFSLKSTSPAIGAGYPAGSIVTNDFLGNPRKNPPSIGAFESALGPAPPTSLIVK